MHLATISNQYFAFDVIACVLVSAPKSEGEKAKNKYACRKALEFAIDAGFTEIILEGDNALVMKMISQAQPDLS